MGPEGSDAERNVEEINRITRPSQPSTAPPTSVSNCQTGHGRDSLPRGELQPLNKGKLAQDLEQWLAFMVAGLLLTRDETAEKGRRHQSGEYSVTKSPLLICQVDVIEWGEVRLKTFPKYLTWLLDVSPMGPCENRGPLFLAQERTEKGSVQRTHDACQSGTTVGN